jgi:hypothetical protein
LEASLKKEWKDSHTTMVAETMPFSLISRLTLYCMYGVQPTELNEKQWPRSRGRRSLPLLTHICTRFLVEMYEAFE